MLIMKHICGGGEVCLPNVSACDDETNVVHYNKAQPNNEIWYTSSDGNIIEPYNPKSVLGVNVISNTYKDGKGVIECDGDITKINGYFIYANADAARLTSIRLPQSITSVYYNAFVGCGNLPKTDGIIYADYVCLGGLGTHVENINIKEGTKFVLDIRSSTTTDEISSLTIPQSVIYIYEKAFEYIEVSESNFINNSDLDEIENGYWGAAAWKLVNDDFKINVVNGALIAYIGTDTDIVLPDEVTSVGSVFNSNPNITSFTIPDTCQMTVLVNSTQVFGRETVNLTNIYIGNNVNTIASVLTSNSDINIVIGTGVTRFATALPFTAGSFTPTNRFTITIKATTPPRLQGPLVQPSDVLDTLYVPAESVDAYKTATLWSSLASKIQPIPTE